RAELGLDEAPVGFLEPTVFRVFDLGQIDEPSLGRQQQTGRFVPRREIEDDAADHARWIVVGAGPPDPHLGADLQRKVNKAVFEILDPREISEPAAVRNRDAHGRKVLWGLAWGVSGHDRSEATIRIARGDKTIKGTSEPQRTAGPPSPTRSAVTVPQPAPASK